MRKIKWYLDPSGSLVLSQEGKSICILVYDQEESQANAHLIAAAPDMYEALKEAEDMLLRIAKLNNVRQVSPYPTYRLNYLKGLIKKALISPSVIKFLKKPLIRLTIPSGGFAFPSFSSNRLFSDISKVLAKRSSESMGGIQSVSFAFCTRKLYARFLFSTNSFSSAILSSPIIYSRGGD